MERKNILVEIKPEDIYLNIDISKIKEGLEKDLPVIKFIQLDETILLHEGGYSMITLSRLGYCSIVDKCPVENPEYNIEGLWTIINKIIKVFRTQIKDIEFNVEIKGL